MASLGIGVTASLDDEDGTPIGRVGILDEGIDAKALAARVGSALDTTVRIADAGSAIRSLAVVPGSGGSFVDLAVGTVDCLITGDVSHHRARSAVDRGMSVLDVGHTAAERPAIGALYAAVLDVTEDVVFIEADPSPWKD